MTQSEYSSSRAQERAVRARAERFYGEAEQQRRAGREEGAAGWARLASLEVAAADTIRDERRAAALEG